MELFTFANAAYIGIFVLGAIFGAKYPTTMTGFTGKVNEFFGWMKGLFIKKTEDSEK